MFNLMGGFPGMGGPAMGNQAETVTLPDTSEKV